MKSRKNFRKTKNNLGQKAFIVLGCPHSATSFVAQSLVRNGVKLQFRSTNNYEDWEFGKTNKVMLRRAGGDSFSPPSEEEIMKVDMDKRIKKLIAKKKDKFWGFKSPLTSLTLKKYLPYLDGDTHLICCFRKPEKIIKGHVGRKDGRINKCFVDHYNKALISAIKEFVEL